MRIAFRQKGWWNESKMGGWDGQGQVYWLRKKKMHQCTAAAKNQRQREWISAGKPNHPSFPPQTAATPPPALLTLWFSRLQSGRTYWQVVGHEMQYSLGNEPVLYASYLPSLFHLYQSYVFSWHRCNKRSTAISTIHTLPVGLTKERDTLINTVYTFLFKGSLMPRRQALSPKEMNQPAWDTALCTVDCGSTNLLWDWPASQHSFVARLPIYLAGEPLCDLWLLVRFAIPEAKSKWSWTLVTFNKSHSSCTKRVTASACTGSSNFSSQISG